MPPRKVLRTATLAAMRDNRANNTLSLRATRIGSLLVSRAAQGLQYLVAGISIGAGASAIASDDAAKSQEAGLLSCFQTCVDGAHSREGLPHLLPNPVWPDGIRYAIREENPQLSFGHAQVAKAVIAELSYFTRDQIAISEASKLEDANLIIEIVDECDAPGDLGKGAVTDYASRDGFTLVERGSIKLKRIRLLNAFKVVAVHELGHALGFGHSANPRSVLADHYSFTADCACDLFVEVNRVYGKWKSLRELSETSAERSNRKPPKTQH